MDYPAFIDDIRRSRGLMTIESIGQLVERGNVIFDPFSVLISESVSIGTGNIIFPCVSLLCSTGELSIGDSNMFHSNSHIEAVSGPIRIGSSNQFGEGGFTAKTNRAEALITIGDHGRYLGGASVFGKTLLGSGSQILGAIAVDGCQLESGQPYQDPDPDRRAGLLKGSGNARNLTVPKGQVISGNGVFAISDIKPQSFFHPKTN